MLYPLSYEGGGPTKRADSAANRWSCVRKGIRPRPRSPKPDDQIPDAGYRCSGPWTVRPEIVWPWQEIHTSAVS